MDIPRNFTAPKSALKGFGSRREKIRCCSNIRRREAGLCISGDSWLNAGFYFMGSFYRCQGGGDQGMDNHWTQLLKMRCPGRNTQLIRKSFIYYLLVFFIVCSGINLQWIHLFRGRYLYNLNSVVPITNDFGVPVLFYDYYLHLNPHDPQGWSELAQSCLFISDFSGAIEAYKKAIRLYPDQKEYYWGLAEAYRSLHQEKKATTVLKSFPGKLAEDNEGSLPVVK